MKRTYIVTVEFQGSIISDFEVEAINLKDARNLAQINKADSCGSYPVNRCKVSVRLKKF